MDGACRMIPFQPRVLKKYITQLLVTQCVNTEASYDATMTTATKFARFTSKTRITYLWTSRGYLALTSVGTALNDMRGGGWFVCSGGGTLAGHPGGGPLNRGILDL